ncbi:MAG: haloacid dehalogenase type II [Chloroflexota bacterium]|nr:haloacid dehalogenase type II [Chloroflexota bacterium]
MTPSRVVSKTVAFDALTFDCYGTLIDWEAGLADRLGAALGTHGIEAPEDDLLASYAREEAALERGAYLPYRQILARCLHNICARYGVTPTETETREFAGSVGDWPAFPDSAPALGRLAGRYRLGVITNCDDDLFALSARRLGDPFDWVVTAQQVRSYKPSRRNFEVALELIGLPPQRVLHVAQSLFHDHVPALELGFATAWIDRRRGKVGYGATPPASARPNIVVPDLASLANLLLSD